MNVEDLAITSSRLMVCVSLWAWLPFPNTEPQWGIYVWDWKTGNLVIVLWLG